MPRLPLTALLTLVPAIACASNFAGRWVADLPATQLPSEPESFELRNGFFLCTSCRPRINVPADGKDHEIEGAVTFDALNVSTDRAGKVRLEKKRSQKRIWVAEMTVAANQQSLDMYITDQPEQARLQTHMQYDRLEGDRTDRGINGNWVAKRVVASYEAARSIQIQDIDSGLAIQYPDGRRFSSKFNDADVDMEGSNEPESVHLLKLGANVIQINRKYNGVLVEATEFITSASSPQMVMLTVDWLQQRRVIWHLIRQSEPASDH